MARVKKVTSRSKRQVTRSISTSLQALFPDFRSARFRASALQKRDAYIREMREAYLHRGLVLYVGAGVSLSVGLPGWSELIRALSVTMMSRRVESAIDMLQKLNDEQKWERLSELQIQVRKKAESDKPILMMARAVKDELGDRLPTAIARTLYRPVWRMLRSMRRDEQLGHRKGLPSSMPQGRPMLPSSDLLDAIVALARAERDVQGVQAIVNYNFDDLLDEKLREQHVRCRTILSGKDVLPQGTLPCYHVHGLIASREFARKWVAHAQGNFVFSEDEYHAEYSDPYKWSNMTQMSLLGRYTGLFVGLSLEDPNIRRLIDVTHRQYPENLNYAILPRKQSLGQERDDSNSVMRNLFEEVETNSFEKIGVRVIWVDLYGEIPELLRGVCSADSC